CTSTRAGRSHCNSQSIDYQSIASGTLALQLSIDRLSIDRERGRSHYNSQSIDYQLSTINRSRAGTLALQLSTLNSQACF
ncbi:MAG: hypothetical protein ACRC62_32535, partial [Microcoleus sp.]